MSGSPRASIPDWVLSLAERARDVDGTPPFSDQALVEVRTGARRVIAIRHEAAALVSDTEAELVVDPSARGRGIGTALLESVLAGGTAGLLIWAHGDHPAARALARGRGLIAVRELLHLELAALPVAAAPALAPGLRLGGFHESDAAEWLALNARVFAEHPEQGRLGAAELAELEREPWFRAEDFLLLRDATGLIGYCWIKIEHDRGEFYVVGVDERRHREGLGRVLVESGLARLGERGVRSAHLYVEAENAAAVGLYRSLGFHDDSIDIQYRAPAPIGHSL